MIGFERKNLVIRKLSEKQLLLAYELWFDWEEQWIWWTCTALFLRKSFRWLFISRLLYILHLWKRNQLQYIQTSRLIFNVNQLIGFQMIQTSTLTLPVTCIFQSCIEIKIKLNFYFHNSLWCLKSFYEDLKGLHKTFWGTTKKCENTNLT